MKHKICIGNVAVLLLLLVVLMLVVGNQSSKTTAVSPITSVIVQADNMDAAKTAVLAVGGSVVRELAVIDAVGAELTENQRAALQETTAVTALYDNSEVTSAAVMPQIKTDFEDGTTQGWKPRGTATVKTVNEVAQSGAKSLKVTGRTSAWHGSSLNVLGSLQPGAVYEISGYVKLVAGQPASRLIITMQRTPAGGTTSYDWIAPSAVNGVTDAKWVLLKGQYSFDTAVSGLDIYVESTNKTVSFYLDNFTITEVSPPPQQEPIIIDEPD